MVYKQVVGADQVEFKALVPQQVLQEVVQVEVDLVGEALEVVMEDRESLQRKSKTEICNFNLRILEKDDGS